MSKFEGGGPAFPCETVGTDKHGEYRLPYQGMTLRDYFAAKAMQAMVSAEFAGSFRPGGWAKDAYEMADSMLAAREGER